MATYVYDEAEEGEVTPETVPVQGEVIWEGLKVQTQNGRVMRRPTCLEQNVMVSKVEREEKLEEEAKENF